MILAQADLDRISHLRRRTLELPVRRGKLGELKRCPLKPQGVYMLKPPVPYDQHRELAEREPTRKRAVVDLLYRCEQPVKTITITVFSVERQDDENGIAVSWLVHFKKGDHSDDFDRDIYLSRNNDFTMDASRQTVVGDAPYLAPLAEDLKRAREKATEKRTEPSRSTIAAYRAAHYRAALKRHTMSVEARRQLDRVGKAIEKLADQLSVDNGGILSASDRAQCPEARESDADTEPDGTESVVSLQSEAA